MKKPSFRGIGLGGVLRGDHLDFPRPGCKQFSVSSGPPLKAETLRRIVAGLDRFVSGSPAAAVVVTDPEEGWGTTRTIIPEEVRCIPYFPTFDTLRCFIPGCRQRGIHSHSSIREAKGRGQRSTFMQWVDALNAHGYRIQPLGTPRVGRSFQARMAMEAGWGEQGEFFLEHDLAACAREVVATACDSSRWGKVRQ